MKEPLEIIMGFGGMIEDYVIALIPNLPGQEERGRKLGSIEDGIVEK